jgi:hypothetical protein
MTMLLGWAMESRLSHNGFTDTTLLTGNIVTTTLISKPLSY